MDYRNIVWGFVIFLIVLSVSTVIAYYSSTNAKNWIDDNILNNKACSTCSSVDKQTDKDTDKQTDKDTDKDTDKQTDNQTGDNKSPTKLKDYMFNPELTSQKLTTFDLLPAQTNDSDLFANFNGSNPRLNSLLDAPKFSMMEKQKQMFDRLGRTMVPVDRSQIQNFRIGLSPDSIMI